MKSAARVKANQQKQYLIPHLTPGLTPLSFARLTKHDFHSPKQTLVIGQIKCTFSYQPRKLNCQANTAQLK